MQTEDASATVSRDANAMGWRGFIRDHAFTYALVVVVGVGVVFRSMGYWIHPIALWGDEAGWATRLLSRGWSAPSFRPIGFMGLADALLHIRVDERLLRLPSYLASLAALYLFYDIGRRLIRWRPALLLMMAIVAAQPMLIDFAKEFKPYSLELCIHLFLLSRTLRYTETRSRRNLAILLSAAVVGFFFAYNVIFFYPALFLVIATLCFRSRNWRRLIVICGGAAACVSAILAMNFLIFRHIPKGERSSAFWGHKYDVFYMDDGKHSEVRWQFEKLEDVVAMPGAGRIFWRRPAIIPDRAFREWRGLEWLSWVVLFVIGASALGRRREWSVLTLFLLPIATVMLFNAARLWPFGAFRTDLFLLAYVLPLPFVGLSAIKGASRRGGIAALAAACALQLYPSLAFGFGLHREKRAWTANDEMPRILGMMRRERDAQLRRTPRAPKEGVLLDWYSCGVYDFYVHDIARTKRRDEDYFVKNFTPQCAGVVTAIAARLRRTDGRPTWVIISNRHWVEPMRRVAARIGHVAFEAQPSYNQLVLRFDGIR